MTCRLDTHWSYRGLRCLRLENEHLAIDVLPELGGKIYRLIDKRADRDVLWHSDRVQPQRAPLHADFDDHWSGGWDEIFPTGERSYNRAGEALPHMGELWTAGAEWQILEDTPRRAEIKLSTKTPITPARWQRRISLEAGSCVLRLAYRVENIGTDPFDFNWGLHPAHALSAQQRFDVPARRGLVADCGGGYLGEAGDRYDWPLLSGLDVREALDPQKRCYALHYLTDLQAGWVATTDRVSRRGFGLVFDLAVFPVVWMWLVYGGWRGYHHAILEPWTGHPSSLDAARAGGQVRELRPGEELETEVVALIYSGVDSVSHLSADGPGLGSVRVQAIERRTT